jgi:hypothetical protein
VRRIISENVTPLLAPTLPQHTGQRSGRINNTVNNVCACKSFMYNKEKLNVINNKELNAFMDVNLHFSTQLHSP